MRRLKRGGIALAVLLGVVLPVLAGDQDGQSTPPVSNWLTDWFGHKDKAAEKKLPNGSEGNPVMLARPAPELASNVFDRESKACLRRMEVCDRLEICAEQAGDAEQVRRVQQLRERVFALYQQRTANLSMTAAAHPQGDASPSVETGVLLGDTPTTSLRGDR